MGTPTRARPPVDVRPSRGSAAATAVGAARRASRPTAPPSSLLRRWMTLELELEPTLGASCHVMV